MCIPVLRYSSHWKYQYVLTDIWDGRRDTNTQRNSPCLNWEAWLTRAAIQTAGVVQQHNTTHVHQDWMHSPSGEIIKNSSLKQDVSPNSIHSFCATPNSVRNKKVNSDQERTKAGGIKPWPERQIMENTCNWLHDIPHSHGKYEQYHCRGARGTAGPSWA